MNIYSAAMIAFMAVWIFLEFGLLFRDRLRGRGGTEKDRGTRVYNILFISAGMTIAGIVNGRQAFFFPGGRTEAGFWTGYCVMLLGFALRVWAIVVLGSSFRTTVETHEGQKVVSGGPYRLVRHPSYSGLVLMGLGYGLALQNWLSLAVALLLPLLPLIYRIRVEEAALVSSMGSEYEDYRKRTKKLIPWIW